MRSGVVDTLIAACETHGLRFDRMISRAYHDSLFISRIAPWRWFHSVPGGVSHRPESTHRQMRSRTYAGTAERWRVCGINGSLFPEKQAPGFDHGANRISRGHRLWEILKYEAHRRAVEAIPMRT